MMSIEQPEHTNRTAAPSTYRAKTSSLQLLFLVALWLVIFVSALWTPPLLDDADSTHAQASQTMLRTGDWVTLKVDGIRYLEKPPLPYWINAVSIKLFGSNAFAIHLPLALSVLALALLACFWGKRAFTEQAGFYGGIFVLTASGVFLFTRIFIPEALLSFLLGTVLFCVLRALDRANEKPTRYAYLAWTMLALAVLAKGLIAIVFVGGALLIYSLITGEWRNWSRLKPVTGALLFLAIAAPWHILAGLRNTGGYQGHGFFWFYFINEHIMRFLNKRIPRDYNKLPGYLYWSLHIVWLFPWSLFLPVALIEGWRARVRLLKPQTFAERSALMLTLFFGLLILFFSFSTNQEYYTFPAYLPILLLTAVAITRSSRRVAIDTVLARAETFAYAAYTLLGAAVAVTLIYGLWSSRHLPFEPDIGDLINRRGVGDYSLSMSHFFDLTTASFAALRLPAALAALAFLTGPATAWTLHRKKRGAASIVAIGLTSALFLVAAHIALVRFSTMLSSRDFAVRIQQLERDGYAAPSSRVLLYGDQTLGSSIPFYLGHPVNLVDGRTSSMWFGSTFADVAPIFWSPDELVREWGHGERKLLFVPEERSRDVAQLLGGRLILLKEASGKRLVTDRPLDRP